MRRPIWSTERWWTCLIALVFAATLCFNAWQEVFGPADPGLQYAGTPPDHRPLVVERVVPGSAMQRAGVQTGDVIEAVGERVVLGQSDWFLARAHFQRDSPIEIRVRRGPERLSLRFTITTSNWQTLSGGDVALQTARPFLLLLGIIVAFTRPSPLDARLAALMFAMISVAEAFPPAGWAASLHRLPAVLSIPVALASVSWLLITVPWLSLSVRFPADLPRPPWFDRIVLAPLIIFMPLMVMSAVAVVYGPIRLAMPTPFLDSAVIRRIQAVWGVIPNLFINLWPAYGPTRQALLLVLWVGMSLLAFLAGLAIFATNSRRARPVSGRREPRITPALAIVVLVAIHNAVLRNWSNVFGARPQAVFYALGFAIEAAAFCLIALTLARAVLRHR